MRSSVALLLLLVLSFSSIIAVIPVHAESKTIIVPDDYVSIQEAIGNALKGDTIYVKKGTYHENLGINKSLSLVGEDRDTTIIDGNPPEGYRVPITIECDKVSVSGFKLLYGYAGIQMGSNNSNISGNRIANAQHGIILVKGDNNSITGNIFESIGLSSAIQLSYSNNNLVSNNYIDSCVEGIQIWQNSNNNIVTGNTIINCQDVAIRFQYSNDNTIMRNNISRSGYGTTIYVSNRNTISNNNYVYNTIQFSANEDYALTFGYNISVNAINENYWSDYKGTDNDGDGIGDTPYVIDENNQDNYPLMKPVAIAGFPSSFPSPEPTPSPAPSPPPAPPLTLSILSPENTTYATNDIPLTFVVDKQTAGVDYSLDGMDARAYILGNTTLPILSEGPHCVTVYAYDGTGNEVSETVYFSVEVPEPFPNVPVAAASIITAVVVAVGLLVYFKKRKREAEPS